MDEFRWIKMFSCLMLMIQIAASVNKSHFMLMKAGDDVTLPCLNVIDDQNNCDGTTWVFTSRIKAVVELITLGKIGTNAQTKSDRLSVTANCSLVIKKVTVQDVGHYNCQQYKVGQTRSQDSLVHQTLVELSVVTVTKDTDTDKVLLNCSVLTHEECHRTVKWLIKGQDVDKENEEIQISQTYCSTAVSFKKSHFLYSSRNNAVKCKVTDTDTGKVQQFPISYQPSGEETGDTKPATKPTRTTKSNTKLETITAINNPTKTSNTKTTKEQTTENKSSTELFTVTTADNESSGDSKDIQWYIIAAVGLVLLLVVVVFVIRWRKKKGNTMQIHENPGVSLNPAVTQSAPQTSQDLGDPEVSYATISYTKTNSKAWVRGDDEGDAVTYSTVKAPSSSAAATADPRNLYSTVTFQTT